MTSLEQLCFICFYAVESHPHWGEILKSACETPSEGMALESGSEHAQHSQFSL